MTTRYIPCPGCGKTYDGKTPRSTLRAACPICKGLGSITQKLENPKRTMVLPTLSFGNMRGAENWDGTSVCVLEKPWCCDHVACLHSPILSSLDLDTLARVIDIPHAQRRAGDGHKISVEVFHPIGVLYDDILRSDKGKLYIHCVLGLERSVLVAAYLLVTRHRYTWERAYHLLYQLNPEIFDRRSWLDWNERMELEQ